MRQQEFEVHGVLADVADAAGVQRIADEALKTFGKIHLVCNNAGVAGGGAVPIWKKTDNDWAWVFGVNFWGVLHGVRTFTPIMLEQGEGGHIVNTASLVGLMYGGGIYGVSKHAVVALTESLYRDLQVRDSQVSASVLCPGFVKTRNIDAERNRPDRLAGAPPEETDATKALRDFAETMIRQGMSPEDVAELVF